VDPVTLVRTARGRAAESSTLGRCDARLELAAVPLPLDLHVPALPCRGGSALAGKLFGPLGWQVSASLALESEPVDPRL
jgi:RNA repair, ligase-Pnkp-associating, region of Hen1